MFLGRPFLGGLFFAEDLSLYRDPFRYYQTKLWFF